MNAGPKNGVKFTRLIAYVREDHFSGADHSLLLATFANSDHIFAPSEDGSHLGKLDWDDPTMMGSIMRTIKDRVRHETAFPRNLVVSAERST